MPTAPCIHDRVGTKSELRMAYLGDGISTDDEGGESEEGGDEADLPAALPAEEGAPEGNDPLENPDEV